MEECSSTTDVSSGTRDTSEGNGSGASEGRTSADNCRVARYREKLRDSLNARKIRLYEQAWNEAIRREGLAAEKHAANRLVMLVNFKVHYVTYPGQEILLVGSSPLLGTWNSDKAFAMHWNEGNIWSVELEVPISSEPLEYKYLVQNPDGQLIWEDGSNHILHAPEFRPGCSLHRMDCWGHG